MAGFFVLYFYQIELQKFRNGVGSAHRVLCHGCGRFQSLGYRLGSIYFASLRDRAAAPIALCTAIGKVTR